MNIRDIIRYTSSIRDKQYKVNKITNLGFKYLQREKQLYISTQAFSLDKSRIYIAQLVFDRVSFKDDPDVKHILPYSSKGMGLNVYLEAPTVTHQLRTRCQCQDYYFMWSFWNKKNKGLIGPHKNYTRVSPPSGRPPVNPLQMPGGCKHILALIKKLMESGIIVKDAETWSYLNRPPKIEK